MKKKIIISANVFFTIVNFRKELIKFLIEKNYEVVCIASQDKLSLKSEHILNKLGVRFINIKISRKGLNPIEDLSYLFSLIKIYKREKADLIFHFTIKPNIYGTIAARIVGVNSINTINGFGSAIIKGGLLSKILKIFYKFSLKFSTKVFFQNKDDRNFFINNKLIEKNKVSIVPGSGVNIESFNNFKVDNEKLTFLLVSRLLKDKGIYEYIEAIKIIQKRYSTQYKFLLGGQFDSENPSAVTEKEVKEWENNNLISYIGQTDNIQDFFNLTNIIVLPSYREGLSRLLIEAASSYKPIITTNVPGCKEVVEDGHNGYLCEVKDVVSLVHCIEKFFRCTDKDLENFGKRSREIAKQKFDYKIVNEIYFKEIEKLC
ncbi:MAG: glycosyltransferase family 4 protein [Arcobacteraceae bacterium]|nr:glycosyltransferase family 4 protein [Arcobacteraceae bacterium]